MTAQRIITAGWAAAGFVLMIEMLHAWPGIPRMVTTAALFFAFVLATEVRS